MPLIAPACRHIAATLPTPTEHNLAYTTGQIRVHRLASLKINARQRFAAKEQMAVHDDGWKDHVIFWITFRRDLEGARHPATNGVAERQ